MTINGDTQDSQSKQHISIHDLTESMYVHMKAIGGNLMKSERKDHTLNATALVNQAVVKLMSSEKAVPFNNRSHLLAAAAKAMERILVDHARGKNTLKRSAGGRKVTWEDVGQAVSSHEQSDLLLQLSDHIQELAGEGARGERCAEILRFRLFGGMQIDEIALVLGQSDSTIEKDWRYAKTFLAERLQIASGQTSASSSPGTDNPAKGKRSN